MGENTVHFSISDRLGKFCLQVRIDEGEDHSLLRMNEVADLVGSHEIDIVFDLGDIIGYDIQSTRGDFNSLLTLLVRAHLERPQLPEHIVSLIGKASWPTMCRECGAGGMKQSGNIFECEACGRVNFPSCCTVCGGDLIINGLDEMTCTMCDLKFVLQAPVISTEHDEGHAAVSGLSKVVADDPTIPNGGLPTFIGIVPPPGGEANTDQ